jgi:hypothetical protein
MLIRVHIIAIAPVILFAAATAVHPPPVRAASAVPNPVVTGPIPATVVPADPSRDYPFFSTNADLERQGYIEEEYFFEGTANQYTSVTSLDTATVSDGGHSYRTRMIVRRPLAPQRFNGTVVMEWQNRATGYDLDAMWAVTHAHLMRRGYAWVGVSAFRASVHTPVTGLKAWNPSRYGSLDVPIVAGNVDALSFDIFSQAAQAVKMPLGVDPMGGLHVERVVGLGTSGSATNGILPYHNTIHSLAGVFDGFFVVIGGSTAALRTDLDVKVFKLWTETEVAGSSLIGRQPDSDHLRRWEVAGAAHFGWELAAALAPLQMRDVNPTPAPWICNLPPFSRVPFAHVANAALDHMVAWVASGVQPPHAPEIQIATIGDPTSIVRDSAGNALGGIRLPEHAVPTAVNTGLNGPATSFCRTFGSHVPFDQSTLDALYANHGTYVSRVARVAQHNVAQGFIVPEDAEATVAAAAHAVTGRY